MLHNMRSGTEPSPHVHSREHEFIYVLDGKLDVHVGNDLFQSGPGKCAFLPVSRPHAFIIRSPQIRMLVLIALGGFMKSLALMAAPAEKMEMPSGSVTCATADLAETMKICLSTVRFPSPEEIAEEMPAFPSSSVA